MPGEPAAVVKLTIRVRDHSWYTSLRKWVSRRELACFEICSNRLVFRKKVGRAFVQILCWHRLVPSRLLREWLPGNTLDVSLPSKPNACIYPRSCPPLAQRDSEVGSIQLQGWVLGLYSFTSASLHLSPVLGVCSFLPSSVVLLLLGPTKSGTLVENLLCAGLEIVFVRTPFRSLVHCNSCRE